MIITMVGTNRELSVPVAFSSSAFTRGCVLFGPIVCFLTISVWIVTSVPCYRWAFRKCSSPSFFFHVTIFIVNSINRTRRNVTLPSKIEIYTVTGPEISLLFQIRRMWGVNKSKSWPIEEIDIQYTSVRSIAISSLAHVTAFDNNGNIWITVDFSVITVACFRSCPLTNSISALLI